jgi:hypothetical protein
VDKLANGVFRLDASGHILNSRQRRGSDPGAFNGPGAVATWNEVVAVSDFASGRIQLLRPDFTPINEFRVAGSVFAMAFDARGHLWVGALRGAGGETLFKYDQDGTELLRRRTQRAADTVFDAVFHLLCGKETVRLVYATRNTVERWDLEGNPLGNTTVSGFPSPEHVKEGDTPDNVEEITPPDILFVSCAEDGTGRLALLVGDVGPYSRREVFSVNENGEIVSLFTLPERSSAIRFNSKGQVLSVENRKTTVSCYQLKRLQ